MKSSVDHVIHSTLRKHADELNCIYFPYNGFYEWMLNSVPMRLHCPKDTLVHEWPCKHWKDNINWLPGGVEVIPNRIDIDAIIVNWRKEVPFIADKIAQQLHISSIIIDHELPAENANKNLRKYVNSRMPSKSVFISCSSLLSDEWAYNDNMEVIEIPYGFKIPDAIAKENEVLVVGDYNYYDTQLLNEMLNAHPNTKCLGYNGHGNKYKSMDEVISEMSKSLVCIMASESTIPPFLAMAAAASGCAIVTNSTRWTNHVFKHGESAMFFDSMPDIKKHVRSLLNNKNKLEDIMMQGKQNIIDNYSMKKFQENWISLMLDISKRIYKR